MSTLEHIFLHAAEEPKAVADRIASAIGLRASIGPEGGIYLSRPAQCGPGGEVGGEVARNYLAYPSDVPEEQSLLDAYEILWDFGYTGRDRDVQLREARRVFEQLSAARLWPAVLVAGLDTLIAAWDPDLGSTWFPSGTSPDAVDRDAWQEYLARLRH
ncbi:hypothetical protein ACFXA2_12420 [Micromonospora chalcea]|uniref:hypothetical protein n=1 Tax=Micromonospora aurantiaca (nom. illeg.) TaxID=47850 RepID=UPI00147734B5|nr:hypothetical protein [Micromonospora aurantiaca]